MDRRRVDPQEVERRQFDDDFFASLDMIGEGSPVFSFLEDDDIPEEVKDEEKKSAKSPVNHRADTPCFQGGRLLNKNPLQAKT
ncbi:hypothetical protein FK545_01720 [Planococcus glaciei]|nr:hypothetical protein [Planococcus glaciei]QDY44687.1 hypothetical protein FK545_01720 [Planococcus glaciei]